MLRQGGQGVDQANSVLDIPWQRIHLIWPSEMGCGSQESYTLVVCWEVLTLISINCTVVQAKKSTMGSWVVLQLVALCCDVHTYLKPPWSHHFDFMITLSVWKIESTTNNHCTLQRNYWFKETPRNFQHVFPTQQEPPNKITTQRSHPSALASSCDSAMPKIPPQHTLMPASRTLAKVSRRSA